MQYALFPFGDKHLLLDADEYRVLLHHQSIPEIGCPEQDSGFHLCYGAYLPQPGKTSDEAREDLLAARDRWIGCLIGTECHLFAFEDVEVFDPIPRGHALAIPLAALIRARDPAPWPEGQKARALTCFLRYGNLSPLENVLNRPGIIALKPFGRPLGAAKPEGWRLLVDPARAKSAAGQIR